MVDYSPADCLKMQGNMRARMTLNFEAGLAMLTLDSRALTGFTSVSSALLTFSETASPSVAFRPLLSLSAPSEGSVSIPSDDDLTCDDGVISEAIVSAVLWLSWKFSTIAPSDEPAAILQCSVVVVREPSAKLDSSF